MSSRARLRNRFHLVAAAVTTLVQLPAVLWLCWLTRTPIPVLVAALLSWPYLRQLQSPWHTTDRSLSTYLALGWWSACLVFGLLMMPTTLAVRAGLPAGAAWGLTGALALGLGADSRAIDKSRGWARRVIQKWVGAARPDS